MTKTRNNVLSKLILDRKFDIPDWIYNEIDHNTLELIIFILRLKNHGNITIEYINNPDARKFFDKIRGRIDIDKLDTRKFDIQLLLYEKDTVTINKDCNSEEYLSLVDGIIRIGLSDDILIDRVKGIIYGLNKETLLKVIYKELAKSFHEGIHELLPIEEKCQYIDRLIKILDIPENYTLTNTALELSIPVFFKYGDYIDLARYLSHIIETSWKGELSEDINNVIIDGGDSYYDIDTVKNNLEYIATNLNMNALLPFSKIPLSTKNYTIERMDKLHKIYFKSLDNRVPIKDFNKIIQIFGKNNYGLSLNIQRKFILNGGDVSTMFNNGVLLLEATIIKTSSEVGFLINTLPTEGLTFLLNNSLDFVMSILSSTSLDYPCMERVLDTLFEYPFNKNLWDTLNKHHAVRTDYRIALINKLTAYIGRETMFNTIPSSMMYVEPGFLYLTSNVNSDNVKYIPIDKVLPYVSSIISNYDYMKFNLNCKGNLVSISKIFSNGELMRLMKEGHYGYICDIEEDKQKEFFELVCDYVKGD